MLLSRRDLDLLRLLRWCRMIRSKELCEAFSKDEVMNLSAAQMIRFSDAAKAWLLTPCGNRVLGSAGFVLPPATAPTYREPDIMRRLRLAQIVTTAYAAGVNIFLTKESELQSQPSLFLPFLHRNRGSNPWGSTRVAALLHTGDLMCAIHWVNPGIGCVALTDELTAFQNHTAAIPAKQRVIIFAASSYSWIHVTGDTTQKRAYLTEGPLKGDIASYFANNALFVCLGGVNAHKGLRETLQSLGVTEVMEAMDMDQFTNPQVRQAITTLRREVQSIPGIRYYQCTWNPRFKGVDDYLLDWTKRRTA